MLDCSPKGWYDIQGFRDVFQACFRVRDRHRPPRVFAADVGSAMCVRRYHQYGPGESLSCEGKDPSTQESVDLIKHFIPQIRWSKITRLLNFKHKSFRYQSVLNSTSYIYYVRVTPVAAAALGSECDSISGFNSSSGENRSCVGEGAGKNGATAHGALSLMRRHRP